MDFLFMEIWPPYVTGVGIGVLCWLTFLFAGKPIGCSTSFASTYGMIERIFMGGKTLEKPYFKKVKPAITLQWIFVMGIIIGAFISALLSGSLKVEWVPSLWAASFGNFPVARFFSAFGGGILIGIGARWAGGCTSGHGISGTLQMAISGWIAVICFFITGIGVAALLY